MFHLLTANDHLRRPLERILLRQVTMQHGYYARLRAYVARHRGDTVMLLK